MKGACIFAEISHRWKCAIVPGALPILVCTDDVLPDLDVSDAMWLIQYSLPRTKTGFGFRFSCLMSNYPNMFDRSTSVSIISYYEFCITFCFKEIRLKYLSYI
jgi:hypothetical protein